MPNFSQSGQKSGPRGGCELNHSEKKTSVIVSHEHREQRDPCRTGTPARRGHRRARVPILQVTVLSDADPCTFFLSLKFQVRPAPATLPIRERNFRLLGICASLRGEELSGSLLETGAHFANGSSRSRLCRTWLRSAGSPPVGGTFGGQETCDVQTFRRATYS